MSTAKLERDIAYCVDELDLSNEQIGEMLRCIVKLGNISVEYFCEEFIFECLDDEGDEDLEQLNRVHDDNYLTINWGLS